MKHYALKKIVVPWDFSEMSQSALEAALAIADSPDKIEVVHVTPYPSSNIHLVWGPAVEKEIRVDIEKSFQEKLKEMELPEEIHFHAIFGDPGQRIADFSQESDAGLVVISSHGHTGLTRLFLGSVAEKVVRLAHCPVLVLR